MEDILLTAEWLEEVFEGVESSDNFLFVISPDSLASEVCARELGHALEQHKRLVPVVRRDARDEPVPEPLAARNWTFFRDEDDYRASFETLVSALETDLDWVSAHTRLLGRALEWEKEGREGSYLLRGRDLQEAEHWVASQSAKRDPQPTPLQLEYVLAARRAATRRQRILVGAALVAVAVSLGLAFLALFQRNEARREARVALSRQLAAQANAERDVRPERSLALATRAATTAETDEARDALSRSLQSSLPSSVVTVGTARVWDAAFSSDGKRLVTASEQGGVRIWDVHSPRSPHLVASLRAKTTLMSARFSPDGRVVVTAGAAGAQIWRAARGTAKPAASFGAAAANMATFSPDGRLVASAAADGLYLWDVRSRRPVGGLSAGQGVAPSWPLLSALTAGGSPQRAGRPPRCGASPPVVDSPPFPTHWRTRSGMSPSGRVAGGRHDGRSRGGSSLAVAFGQPRKSAQRARGRRPECRLQLGRSLPRHGGRRRHRAGLGRRNTQTAAQLLGHNGSVLSASFRPDGRVIATGGADGTFASGRLRSSRTRAGDANRKTLRDIDFSPDGRRLVTASEDGTGRVWDGSSLVYTLQHGRKGEADDWVESASFSQDGSRILTAGSDGTAKVWSAKTGALLTTVDREDGQPLFAADLSSETPWSPRAATAASCACGSWGRALGQSSVGVQQRASTGSPSPRQGDSWRARPGTARCGSGRSRARKRRSPRCAATAANSGAWRSAPTEHG